MNSSASEVNEMKSITSRIGKINLNKKESFEVVQASQETRMHIELNANKQFFTGFTLMCWNIAGTTKKGSNEQTRNLVNKLLVDESPDIVAIQEPLWVQSQMTKKHIIVKNFLNNESILYSYIGVKKQAGFLYKPNKFVVTKYFYKGQLTHNMRILLEERTSMALFKHKDVKDFIICSYHGPYSGYETPQLIIWAKQYLLTLKRIQEEIKIPIFVAGDFNCNISDINESGISVAQIADNRRESEPIDFFGHFSQISCSWRGSMRNIRCIDYPEELTFEGISNHYPLVTDILWSKAPVKLANKKN